MKRKTTLIACCAALAMLSACATDKASISSDLTLALGAASAAEGVYAANPKSDPATVAEMSRLLATAQAALAAWQTSSAPIDQTAAAAAIAALVQYETSAPKS